VPRCTSTPTLDVMPPPIDGDGRPRRTNAFADRQDAIIARIDGVHVVAMGQRVRLAVKTHLLHFFDPAERRPLR
jgi:hypothetical protein